MSENHEFDLKKFHVKCFFPPIMPPKYSSLIIKNLRDSNSLFTNDALPNLLTYQIKVLNFSQIENEHL